MSGEYDYGEVIHAFGENGELSDGAQIAFNNFMSGTVNPAIAAASGGGGVTDHGALTGLSDDDHPQYALADGSRGSFATTAQGALADTSVQEGDPRLTNARTPTTHQHSASDINSGTLGIARIPTGTTSSTVALGNHTHSAASVGAAPASHTHDDRYYTEAEADGRFVRTVNGTGPDAAGDVVVAGGGEFELRGTGMPNGVVTADPGTYYTDTAGTNGAWRWLKKSGTGNTGWTVIHGDTGWREIKTTLLDPAYWDVANSQIQVRRVASAPGMGMARVALRRSAASGGEWTLADIPMGFRSPQYDTAILFLSWRDSGIAAARINGAHYNWQWRLQSMSGNETAPLGQYWRTVHGAQYYELAPGTNLDWPTVLPGVPG